MLSVHGTKYEGDKNFQSVVPAYLGLWWDPVGFYTSFAHFFSHRTLFSIVPYIHT
jgi:hypothetical protein